MTRSPCVDAACRFFREIVAASPRTARLAQAAIAIGLGLSPYVAARWRRMPPRDRWSISRPSPRRSTAPDQGQRGDVERLADRRSRLRRDPFQQAQPDQHRQRQEPRPGVELRPRVDARRRGDAARGRRRHVRRPARGASSTPSTRAPASSSGRYDPEVPPARRATRPAATSSTAASRSTRARSSSARSTAGYRARRRDRQGGLGEGHHRRPDAAYTITGAPRVVKGKVIIGNGGAEYGVRGYVTAYDAETGELRWRFFTVPGDPSQALRGRSRWQRAAKTWDPAASGGRSAAAARCGTRIAYDPDLDLVYVGTGNGSPWNRSMRSPAGGDNLYLVVDRRARTPTPANTSGTTRRRPATTGTTPSPSR